MHPQGLVSAIAYGTVAVGANFANKSAMLLFPFAPDMVLLVQLVAMFLTAESLRCTGVMYFPSFSPGRFWQLLPLSLAYMVHAMLVLRSLLYLNVAVYNTLKRMTPVLVLLFKALHERKLPGAQEVACVCLIVTGCIIAGAGDLSYSPSGYATALLCASVQAVYILLAEANERAKAAGKLKGALERPLLPVVLPAAALPMAPHTSKLGSSELSDLASHGDATQGVGGTEHRGLELALGRRGGGSGLDEPALAALGVPMSNLSSSLEVLYYTSLTAIPLLCLVAVVNKESGTLPRMLSLLQEDNSVGEWHETTAWVVAVAWTETALAGTLVWCTECNSGLTTSIVGVLKGVVAVILGLVFMAGASKPTPMNLAGIAMVLVGGTWYSLQQCSRARPRP